MSWKIEIALTLIRDDLSQELSPEELARAVNLSPSRFRHLFKDATGLSLKQYFKLLRMRKAKELLETTLLSVKQIMSIIGVQDRSHFIRDFKRAYGFTPTQYREQHLHSVIIKRPAGGSRGGQAGHKKAGSAAK